MTESVIREIEKEIESFNNTKKNTAKKIYEILKLNCKTFGDVDKEFKELEREMYFSYDKKSKSDEILKSLKEIIEEEKSNSIIENNSLKD